MLPHAAGSAISSRQSDCRRFLAHVQPGNQKKDEYLSCFGYVRASAADHSRLLFRRALRRCLCFQIFCIRLRVDRLADDMQLDIVADLRDVSTQAEVGAYFPRVLSAAQSTVKKPQSRRRGQRTDFPMPGCNRKSPLDRRHDPFIRTVCLVNDAPDDTPTDPSS